MQNRLPAHPCMVVEHREGEHGYRVSPEGMRGSNPTQGLPRPGFQSWEKEFPQNWMVKVSGNSGHLGEMEEN